MKRKTPYYVSGLALLAVITYIFFPGFSLSPEEVIQNASANYESLGQENKIYHEQRLDQHFSGEEMTEQSLEELWINAKTGEFLQTSRDPGNNTLFRASGTSKQGDSYEFPATEMEGGETSAWMKTFWGDKIICKSSTTQDSTVAVGILQIAAEDPTVNTVSGMSYETDESIDDSLTSQLMNGSSLESIQNVLKNFSGGTDVESKYEERNEDGIDYYVFTEHWQNKDDSGIQKEIIESYFNASTFKLEKTKKIIEENNEYDVNNYLQVEELDDSESNPIFNFENLGMQLSEGISAGVSQIILESEDGCYDATNQKLSDDEQKTLFEQIDEKTISDWETMPSGVLKSNKSFNETHNISSDDQMNFIRPTVGYITQGFTTEHPAYDIANDEGTEVLAVADGTVINVGAGWNGGYGNAVTIDHGNGYETIYAHLESVSVKTGETVKQGQEIGVMGSTGRTFGKTGTHLHFELHYNGEKINPSSLIEF